MIHYVFFIFSKWKVSEEKVTAICSVPDSNQIVTASKSIKVWNVDTKEIVRTFTGHSSEVTFLYVVPQPEKESSYVISGSKVRLILL